MEDTPGQISETEQQTIHRMDDVLASQVAAGEVVERPASVIKELVENSIDAGAKTIRVEIQRGGVACMKVTDDGKGMSRTDLALCLQRHATSKLLNFEDLFNIQQMGFRGEALPSIASVAHVRICTRRRQDIEGSLLVCHGGAEEEISATGCPVGTEIEVRDLFYNTPVRRKFLKSVETESGHIEHQLKLHALAFPEVRFIFIKEGLVVFDVPATHDLRQRIAEFTGREAAERLLRIRPFSSMGVQVRGYLSPLTEARRNRRQQFVFLNARPIEDKIISRAVRDGFGGFPTGLQPDLFLYLEVEPALVDVNVHPAKREVRFRRPSDVSLAITDAVAATLTEYARGQAAPAPMAEPSRRIIPSAAPVFPVSGGAAPVSRRIIPSAPHEAPEPAAEAEQAQEAPAPPPPLRLVTEPRQQDLELPPAPAPHVEEPMPEEQSRFRHMGVIRGQYALFESPEGLALLSVRAARERIIFERLMEVNKRPVPAQRLLQPALVELDARDVGVAKDLQPLLMQAGFMIESFGARTLRVEAIPIFLPLNKVEHFIMELIVTYSSGETRLRRDSNPFRPFAMHLAAQYARQEDMAAWLEDPMPLLLDLLRCENPYCTARGKPTMIPFPLSEIQRRFQAQ